MIELNIKIDDEQLENTINNAEQLKDNDKVFASLTEVVKAKSKSRTHWKLSQNWRQKPSKISTLKLKLCMAMTGRRLQELDTRSHGHLLVQYT